MLHAFVIGLGAFLLFLIQPLLGRELLPWLGGSASVWSACLATFQLCLLIGYLYADRLARHCSATGQRRIHVAILAVSLLFLPALPTHFARRPAADAVPTLAIVEWILISTGLPLLLLSATSPLMSAWYQRTPGTKSVYRLYALSNAGSLLAVFGYPFLIEPYFTLRQQKLGWSAAYAFFALAAGFLCLRPTSPTEEPPPATTVGSPSRPPRALWFALAMCGSAMLTSTTNLLSQEVAVVPFLWLAPLGIYLLTLIVAFDHPRWYSRRIWIIILTLTALPQCAMLYGGARFPFEIQLGIGWLTLLASCLVCHGELSRARPAESQLTSYYLVIAAGGCAGGLFVAVLAPQLFSGYWEYHLSLWGSCLLAAVATHRNGAWSSTAKPEIRLIASMGLVALAAVLMGEAYAGELHSRVTRRSFYGVLRLVDGEDEVGRYRKLAHGRIAHGLQYVDEDKQDWATLYFGRRSAVGITFEHLRTAPGPLRVGIVGLGTGTIATYGLAGDVFRFYELNPDVDWFAREYFTNVKRSPAHVEILLGDARVSLERELESAGSQEYDLLIVDAFRNDAIPIHLLTRECAAIYFRHLKDSGALLLHISNRFVNLEPVVRGLAAANSRPVVRVHAGAEPERGAKSGTWMVVTNDDRLRSRLAAASESPDENTAEQILWTDDFSALWQIIR